MSTVEPQDATPKLNRRRFQYSLRSLLIFVTLCSVALACYALYQRPREAQRAYEKAKIDFINGKASWEELCRASRTLRDAEWRVPFGSRVAAGVSHLKRLRDLAWEAELDLDDQPYVGRRSWSWSHGGDPIAKRVYSNGLVASYSDDAYWSNVEDTTREYIREAEDWLIARGGDPSAGREGHAAGQPGNSAP
jgi:hypothetical protein